MWKKNNVSGRNMLYPVRVLQFDGRQTYFRKGRTEKHLIVLCQIISSITIGFEQDDGKIKSISLFQISRSSDFFLVYRICLDKRTEAYHIVK